MTAPKQPSGTQDLAEQIARAWFEAEEPSGEWPGRWDALRADGAIRSTSECRQNPSAEGFECGSTACGADVRLWPDGAVSVHCADDHGYVAVRYDRGYWSFTSTGFTVPADAQRMVPAGALLELLPELDELATEAGSCSEEAEVWVQSATDRLCVRLGFLLDESPDSLAREGES